jgi:hypothetical protein
MLARAASSRIRVPLICLAAFLPRAVCAFVGPDHFRAYTAYFHVADTLARNGGYCREPGRSCAFFPPVWPTVVAAAILTGLLAGAGAVWMTARIGVLLLSPSAG